MKWLVIITLFSRIRLSSNIRLIGFWVNSFICPELWHGFCRSKKICNSLPVLWDLLDFGRSGLLLKCIIWSIVSHLWWRWLEFLLLRLLLLRRKQLDWVFFLFLIIEFKLFVFLKKSFDWRIQILFIIVLNWIFVLWVCLLVRLK